MSIQTASNSSISYFVSLGTCHCWSRIFTRAKKVWIVVGRSDFFFCHATRHWWTIPGHQNWTILTEFAGSVYYFVSTDVIFYDMENSSANCQNGVHASCHPTRRVPQPQQRGNRLADRASVDLMQSLTKWRNDEMKINRNWIAYIELLLLQSLVFSFLHSSATSLTLQSAKSICQLHQLWNHYLLSSSAMTRLKSILLPPLSISLAVAVTGYGLSLR